MAREVDAFISYFYWKGPALEYARETQLKTLLCHAFPTSHSCSHLLSFINFPPSTHHINTEVFQRFYSVDYFSCQLIFIRIQILNSEKCKTF